MSLTLPSPLLLRPAVNGIVLNSQREVLLTRRSAKVREPGKWCLPGGHLEPGEFWSVAMQREMQEEVGLNVRGQRLVGIYSDPTLTVTEEKLWDGAYGHFIVASFLVTEYDGEVTPNEEVDLWGWFSLDKLPDPMIRSHPIRIKDALEFRGEAFIR